MRGSTLVAPLLLLAGLSSAAACAGFTKAQAALKLAAGQPGADAAYIPPIPVAPPDFSPPNRIPLLPDGRSEPDWGFTPGRLCTADDPDFEQYRYAERIPYCRRDVTYEMKKEVAAHYGVPQSDWHNYEFDHLIPLAIGGNSRVENLWPQPRGQQDSDGKDKLEFSLYRQLEAGQITQAEAVRQIYAWFGRQPQPPLAPPTPAQAR